MTRTNFSSGIGAVGYAACELLSRSYPTCVWPLDRAPGDSSPVTLPNGRILPAVSDLEAIKVFFYADVLWNGAYDTNAIRVPKHGLRIAHMAYDSDQLPERWIDLLNERFDVALFSSRHLEEVATRSGVHTPVGTLPIGLDIDDLLARPWASAAPGRIRFGSIAAFHDRKALGTLVRAFIAEFDGDPEAELVLHSNVAAGTTYKQIMALVRGHSNIQVTHQPLSAQEKDDLIGSFDIFVNCSRGEGYSIGPREALALGKPVVVSDIGAHSDLTGVDGVFTIPTSVRVPARYPEIDDLIVGHQYAVAESDVRVALRQAADLVRSGSAGDTARSRRERAAEFSFGRLAGDYAHVIDPHRRLYRRRARGSSFTHLPNTVRDEAVRLVGPRASRLHSTSRVVVPAYDGGFFSVFNSFMSYLTWNLADDRVHMTLPDWDVSRLVERVAPGKVLSFCYGQPEDGNLWTKLFEPLFGLTDDEMNDRNYLYRNATTPRLNHNEDREPLLTYIHAYELYRRPNFRRFRRQYHQVFRDHVQLRAGLAAEIDRFCGAEYGDNYMIAAHVKHPSHIIEQPGQSLAQTQLYVDGVRRQLAKRGIPASSKSWRVFLATDQDRVINQFVGEFGDRVCFFPDVRRTSDSEDAAYDALSAEDQAREGHQVQHLVAADPANWTIRMAEEVIRDVVAMSRCSALLHVVSNVSTAASYFNPDLELEFIE